MYHMKAVLASNFFYIISLWDRSKIKMVILSSTLTMSLILHFTHVYSSPFPKADRDRSHFRLSVHATYFLAWNPLPSSTWKMPTTVKFQETQVRNKVLKNKCKSGEINKIYIQTIQIWIGSQMSKLKKLVHRLFSRNINGMSEADNAVYV